MSAAIETWMLSSHSLDWLLTTVWWPLNKEYVEAVREAGRSWFEQSVYSDHAGLQLDSGVVYLLDTLEIDLRKLRLAGYEELNAAPVAIPPVPLNIEEIPVRRGVLDLVSLRSEDRVRSRLFGPLEAPTTKISARQKSTRLGEPAKRFLNQFLLCFRENFFKKTVDATRKHFAVDLQRLCIKKIHEALEGRKPHIQEKVRRLEVEGARLRRMLTPLESLRAQSAELSAKVHALETQFTTTEGEALLQPLPRHTPKEQPEGRPKGKTSS
jgi:hypothetical protein